MQYEKLFGNWPNLAYRKIVASFGIMFAGILALASTCCGQKSPGLLAEPPDSGKYVETEHGLMVAYEVTIPGSEVTFSMQPIPGGKFRFEIPNVATDENDRHVEPRFVEIEMQPFWMATHEVTWAEYEQFMNLNIHFRKFNNQGVRRVTDANRIDAVTAPSRVYDVGWRIENCGGGPNHAAGSMTQHSAKQYSKFISKSVGNFYRLPSAAQWQYACMAGQQPMPDSNNELDRITKESWHAANSEYARQKVGQFPANEWGLHDMHGNVSEWVLDGGQFDEDKWEEAISKDEEAISWAKVYMGHLALGGDAFDLPENCLNNSFKVSTLDWWAEDPDVPKSPFWTASDTSLCVGFRLVRPLIEPESEQEKEGFWKPDCEELQNDIKNSIESYGRAIHGIVDEGLSDAIKRMER